MIELKSPTAKEQPKPKHSYKKKNLEISTNRKQTNNINNYFKSTIPIEDNPIQDNLNKDNSDAQTHVPIEAGFSSASTKQQFLVGRCDSVSDSNQSDTRIAFS